MTTNAKANAGFAAKFHNIFKPRDIFLHDGKSLRRFTIGAKLQMAAALAAFAFLLSGRPSPPSQAIAAMNGDVARMQRQVAQMQTDVAAIRTASAQRAALLERRQAFLAADAVRPCQRDAARRSSIPAAMTDPNNPAAAGDDRTRFDQVERCRPPSSIAPRR